MRDEPCLEQYIPLDKGWIIRMGFLDLTRGYGLKDLIEFLNGQNDLGGDVRALRMVAESWKDAFKPLDVGESRTIYCLVRFYLWKQDVDRKIITRGTLTKRVEEMEATANIVRWPLARLLTLEKGTSQWATAAILCGNTEKLPDISFYLQKTYDALLRWTSWRKKGLIWMPQTDPTLTTQALEYISFLKTGKIFIRPNQLGDCDLYCFLRAFNAITNEEGLKMWPQVQTHESNRIEEMERTLNELYTGKIIISDDHRVVQANAMLLQSLYMSTNSHNLGTVVDIVKNKFNNPGCVNKTWPKFWDFLKDIHKFL